MKTMKTSKYLLPLILSASLFSGVAMAQSEAQTAPQTQIEVKNEVPRSTTTTPNIDIDMPDAPDVNVTTPGNSTSTHETVTERSNTTIIDDNDDVDTVASNNIWLYVVFGVLALFLIGMFAMSGRRTALD